ncbi:hypothetical protein M2459_001684 [Parabacteroides sp. PF5-5]|uniref:fimbrillin family protein n=1 Tax=unclassified Parabacteroides TaxID=2649774 RepID=UPI002475DDA2|nr:MULTISPECIES: fimbrillin family protein [unclassified Parabacteroides]MDH6304947.1 hypothetical protein [Parabacteroides sp. PH5-39]MDH6315967.1 hypothetical protein [Parabacteroides sp. PF5-13]MDH6319624.1 hypothetical protein [Parabacteroides sp. PH5-13]MDH6323355.1 hypothetical protein [Parabacteroides sp. PH5-8]MDH6327136.1 hypothetical protein [Parabacteroides sp. PH5-41]
MKKIYLLAAMAVALTLGSCSNDEELNNTQKESSGKEISFRSFIDKGTDTRATIATGENILGFTVTGWWDKENEIQKAKDAGASTTSAAVAEAVKKASADEYMFNAYDITRRESVIGDWTYSPMRYWPSADIIGGGVSFFAYSPASSKNVSKGLHGFQGDKLTYTVPNPVTQAQIKNTAQEDFLLAKTDPKTDGKVELTFAHVLSRVKFFAKTTKPNLTYIIGGVEMLDLAMTGSIDFKDIPTNATFAPYPAVSADPLVLWTPDASKDKMVLDMGDSPINLLSDFKSLHGESNALMVLPQKTTLGSPTDKSGFLIKLSYKAYLNNPSGTYYAGDKNNYEDVYFMVTDLARSTDKGNNVPFTFEIGRQYNFCFTFGSEVGDDIKFDVAVSKWDDNPTIYVPQVDYYGSGLISKSLAKLANPSGYSTQGVTLNQIEAVAGNDEKIITIASDADADLTGLEYFTGMTNLCLDLTTNVVKIDLKHSSLKTLKIKAPDKFKEIGTLDISGIPTTTQLISSQAANGTIGITKLIVWDDFPVANLTGYGFFNTYYSGSGDSTFTIEEIETVSGTVLSSTSTKYPKN